MEVIDLMEVVMDAQLEEVIEVKQLVVGKQVQQLKVIIDNFKLVVAEGKQLVVTISKVKVVVVDKLDVAMDKQEAIIKLITYMLERVVIAADK